MPMLVLLLVLTLFSCNTAQQQPMTANATAPAPIDLSITTDGGFTGRGLGSITIHDADVTTDRCNSTLEDNERAQLAKLLAAAHPERWSETKSTGHPDQVKYTLTSGGHTASFHDENDAPADVRALFDAAWKVRQRVVAGCV